MNNFISKSWKLAKASSALFFLCVILVIQSVAKPIQIHQKSKETLKEKARRSNFLTGVVFKSGIIRRCKFYQVASWKDCDRAGKIFLKVLDFKNIEIDKDLGKVQTIVFKSRLLELSKNKRTQAYIDRLKSELSLIPYIEFNLWEFTLDFFESFEIANEHLAIFFQDVIHNKRAPHLIYMKRLGVNKKFVENLTIVLNLLNENIRDYSDRHHILYPKEVWADLDGARTDLLYHFYVMSYMAIKFKSKLESDKLAFFIPFSFNYIYELIMDSDKSIRVLFDPKKFNSISGIKDIYMGYVASLFGLEKEIQIEYDLFKTQSEENFIGLVRESI